MQINCDKEKMRNIKLTTKRIVSIVKIISLIVCLFILPGNAKYESSKDKFDYRSINELEFINYEDTMSYEEMLDFMKKSAYSESEISEFKYQNLKLSSNLRKDGNFNVSLGVLSSTEVRYSLFYMNTYSYTHGFMQLCKVQARFSVGLEYDVGASSPNRIVSLKGEHVYTGGGTKCMFSGTIFYQLEAGNRFYYSMYGNLYTGGSVNWSAGGAIGVGGNATLNATISNGTGFIRNISEAETYESSGMEP